jgi:lipopolysaccharide biosynthesis glycosyltransferase
MPHSFQNTIHLVIVTANNKFNEMALTLIKSVMFHRRKPYNLMFHIFTDSQGTINMSNFFNYTNNTCIKFRFYQIETLIKTGQIFLDKYGIVISHYSLFHGFSKVFIHDFLPSDMSRVILLDVDIIVLDDIYSIWEQFKLFKSGITALGLVPWYPSVPIDYKYKGVGPDPFTTGVVLIDIKTCRSINLTQLLTNTTETALKQFQLKFFWTADQTMLSLFTVYFPQYVVSLPCFVNGHTIHSLQDGSTWKSACSNEYPRNAHVVPSKCLLDQTDYFGHLYIFYKDMPIEWLSYCLTSFTST